MCGIAGKMVFGRDEQVDREVVLAMTAALAHRGPQGFGLHIGRYAALGHRRLEAAGQGRERQPISNEAQTIWAALDGDVFNARELRADLETRGRIFATTSAAEVIVHAYEEWGDAFVQRLRGTFALAIWDARRSRLLLARDRLGVQPLSYSVLEGRAVVFASESRALLEDPAVSRDWDPVAVREYLALGYVPSPGTIFRRIMKLLPGHLLTAEHGRVRVTRYWDVPFTAEQRDERDYVDTLGALVDEASEMQSAGECPVAVALSPRPASAALLASLTQVNAAPLIATTVGLDAPPLAELRRARSIAKHLGCPHRAELITPRLPDLLPQLASYLDEPLADPAAVTTYHVAAAARALAGVALSAAGSDETWAGHRHHRIEYLEARTRCRLGPLSFAVGVVGRLAPVSCEPVRSARHLVFPESEACARHRATPMPALHRLFSSEFAHETAGMDELSSLRSAHRNCLSRDGLARALYVDLKTRLADNVLTRIDRMSAAVGLRTRLPLLDHRIVEFAATVPSSLKLRGKASHYLFRRLLDGRVPAALLEDTGQPFEAQPAGWLRGPLASMASDVLLSGRFRQRGLFDAKAVTRAWQAHLTGHRDHHRELWSLFMLELWFSRFVDGGQRGLRAA